MSKRKTWKVEARQYEGVDSFTGKRHRLVGQFTLNLPAGYVPGDNLDIKLVLSRLPPFPKPEP